MKKITKSILAACTAFAMALAIPAAGFISSAPVFAEETGTQTGSITLSSANTNSTYVAYPVFTGTLDSAGDLSYIQWSDQVNGADILADLKDNKTIGSYFKDCTTAADAADVLATIKTQNPSLEDAQIAQIFSNIVLENLAAGAQGFTLNSNGTPTSVPIGYYLIVDKTPELQDGQARSALILRVAGTNTSVAPKTVNPTFNKSISNDGTNFSPNDTATGQIGDTFTFKLETKLNGLWLMSYETYKLEFNDTLAKGLTFTDNVTVTVTTPNGTNGTTTETLEASAFEVSELTVNTDGSSSFTVSIANLKDTVSYANGEVTVTVTYTATLNSDAIAIGENTGTGGTPGNSNTAYVKYSDDPNNSGEGSTPEGETTPDSVQAVTYSIDITKYRNFVDDNNTLPRAGFTLYLNDAAVPVKGTAGSYVICDASDPDVVKNYEMFTGEDGGLKIAGLKGGIQYTLKETTVPDGYNQNAGPWDITVNADTAESADASSVVITDLSTTVSGNQITGSASGTDISIVNTSRASLPSTGGAGTTAFYTIGGCLAAGAAILFATNKRMRKED